MFDFAEATKDMTAAEILNYYRNLYYAEPQVTERGIVANAINDYFREAAQRTEWISVEERLPEENVAVLIWHGKIDVAKIHKGITKADREKMERGELLDPMEFGWTLGGVVSIPRSKSFKGCDEFGNNHVPYNWVAISGPMEWFGQDVSYWMPLPESPKP